MRAPIATAKIVDVFVKLGFAIFWHIKAKRVNVVMYVYARNLVLLGMRFNSSVIAKASSGNLKHAWKINQAATVLRSKLKISSDRLYAVFPKSIVKPYMDRGRNEISIFRAKPFKSKKEPTVNAVKTPMDERFSKRLSFFANWK